MEGRIFKGPKVYFRGLRDLRYLVRVLFVVDFPMARDMAVGHPYLSAAPDQFIYVSLNYLSVPCRTIYRAVVCCVVAASIYARVLFRDTIYVIRYCVVGNKVAEWFDYFG